MRDFKSTLSTAALILALGACGNDQPATQAPASTAAPAAVTSAEPVSTPAAAPVAAPVAADQAPAAAGTDEELVYDPIDVSKLDNQWWRQYSAGG